MVIIGKAPLPLSQSTSSLSNSYKLQIVKNTCAFNIYGNSNSTLTCHTTWLIVQLFYSLSLHVHGELNINYIKSFYL